MRLLDYSNNNIIPNVFPLSWAYSQLYLSMYFYTLNYTSKIIMAEVFGGVLLGQEVIGRF